MGVPVCIRVSFRKKMSSVVQRGSATSQQHREGEGQSSVHQSVPAQTPQKTVSESRTTIDSESKKEGKEILKVGKPPPTIPFFPDKLKKQRQLDMEDQTGD